jgi:hypothetical protein
MAYNVSAVNEPARAGRQHGEAGSRPFQSYTVHGLPGQRAKRASVNPACYVKLEPRLPGAASAMRIKLSPQAIPPVSRLTPLMRHRYDKNMIAFDRVDEVEGKTPKKNSPQIAAERRSDRRVLGDQQLSIL